MTKSKKNQKARKTKTTKTSKRAARPRNASHADDGDIGATWSDVLLSALPILAWFLAETDDDDADEYTDRVPLCSVCGRLLELPGADHIRVPTEHITPFPAYRDLGALFTKAAA